MAKYSDIKGFTVQTLSSDTVDNAVPVGTWASGGALGTARSAKGSSAGTQNASSVLVVKLHLALLIFMNSITEVHGQQPQK